MISKPQAKAFSKYTGDTHVRLDTTPMSPPETKKLLASTLDLSLGDKAFRFVVYLALVAREYPIQLTHRQIGKMLQCSERHAQRLVVALEEGNRIRIERNGRTANLYSLYSSKLAHARQSCIQCGKGREKFNAIGVCIPCQRDNSLERKIVQFQHDHPGESPEMQYAGVRMSRRFKELLQKIEDRKQKQG